MELSENLKMRLDRATGETHQDKLARAADVNAASDGGLIDEAESQMRKALGLLGDGQRQRHDHDHERIEQTGRLGDRFNGGLHRRRFVQDGDIPVTVVRRDQAHETSTHRGAPPPAQPSNSRLQRVEAALAIEVAARERAERALGEAQAHARDLQTKIGHADLAKHEAAEAARRDQELIVQLRADAEAWQVRHEGLLASLRAAEQAAEAWQEKLALEQDGRKAAEIALKEAEVSRQEAEKLAKMLDQKPKLARRVTPVRRGVEADVTVASAIRRATTATTVEPEPVKWWLNTKPVAKRR